MAGAIRVGVRSGRLGNLAAALALAAGCNFPRDAVDVDVGKSHVRVEPRLRHLVEEGGSVDVTVLLRDAGYVPVRDVEVTLQATGPGEVLPPKLVTNHQGVAGAKLRGTAVGTVALAASVGGEKAPKLLRRPSSVLFYDCTDRVQNGGEEGVDCGGPCAPCPDCQSHPEAPGCNDSPSDPCAPNPCEEPHKSQCSNEGGVAVCTCDPGYVEEGGVCSPVESACHEPCDDADPCTLQDQCVQDVCQGVEPASPPGVLHVSRSALSPGSGTSWCRAFTELQPALAAATQGDAIWVAAGTYSPGADRSDTFFVPAGVALYGGFQGHESQLEQRDWEAYPTVLSGDVAGNDNRLANQEENNFHVLTLSGNEGITRLDGFIISGGNADGADPDTHESRGGGVLMIDAQATIAHCVVRYNKSAEQGAGIWAGETGELAIEHSEFVVNHTSGAGAGLYAKGIALGVRDTAFRITVANTGGGGGVYAESSSAVFVRTTFIDGLSFGDGGGVALIGDPGSSARIVSSRFISNLAVDRGGAIHSRGGSLVVINTLFNANLAGGYGGAVHASANVELDFSSCTFASNASAGNDPGAAIFCATVSTLPTVSNCVFGNHDFDAPEIAVAQNFNAFTLNHTCIEGGWSGGGIGNIAASPQFRDIDGADDVPHNEDDDLRLSSTSACIDAGDNTAVPPDSEDLDMDGDTTEPIPVDLDGNPRFLDAEAVPDQGNGDAPVCDAGAFEFAD